VLVRVGVCWMCLDILAIGSTDAVLCHGKCFQVSRCICMSVVSRNHGSSLCISYVRCPMSLTLQWPKDCSPSPLLHFDGYVGVKVLTASALLHSPCSPQICEANPYISLQYTPRACRICFWPTPTTRLQCDHELHNTPVFRR
jgi:hypothetical protein